MNKRLALRILSLVGLALSLPAAQADTKPFKIGFILPMTGQSASTGRQEEAAIRSEFPELFGRGRRGEMGNGEAAVPRRRRAMSAAARKVVSERMRKYWAERRKSKAGK